MKTRGNCVLLLVLILSSLALVVIAEVHRAEADCGNNPTILEEHFETWPPPGWSIVNNGGDCGWESTATTGRPNYAGGDGDAADADFNWCEDLMDTDLITPIMDLSGYRSAELNFVAAYSNIMGPAWGYFEVDVSSNGGTSWTTLLSWSGSHSDQGPGEYVSLDLTPYISSQVQVRFSSLAYSLPFLYWCEVDDVYVCGVSSQVKAVPALGTGGAITLTLLILCTGSILILRHRNLRGVIKKRLS